MVNKIQRDRYGNTCNVLLTNLLTLVMAESYQEYFDRELYREVSLILTEKLMVQKFIYLLVITYTLDLLPFLSN